MNKCTHQFSKEECAELLELATDAAGNLAEVARRTCISRRRLGKIKVGARMNVAEHYALFLLATGRLCHVG